MSSAWFLTLFLLIGGGFTLWCSLRNYDWFFGEGDSWVSLLIGVQAKWLIQLLGRQRVRIVYVVFGAILFGWGMARVIDPPRAIPTEFVFELAKPHGIDLTERNSTEKLVAIGNKVQGLFTDKQGWIEFRRVLSSNDVNYINARDSAVAFSDFDEGFNFKEQGKPPNLVGGRILYFNSKLESCDNFLFSKRPLDSAVFKMVICSREVSEENGCEDGLLIFYYRTKAHALSKRVVE